MSIFNIKAPLESGGVAKSNAIRKALYGPHYDGSPNAKQQEAMAAAEVGPVAPPTADLPTNTDPNLLEAVKQEDAKAKKRKTVAKTLLGGDAGAPASTTSTTLLGSSF